MAGLTRTGLRLRFFFAAPQCLPGLRGVEESVYQIQDLSKVLYEVASVEGLRWSGACAGHRHNVYVHLSVPFTFLGFPARDRHSAPSDRPYGCSVTPPRRNSLVCIPVGSPPTSGLEKPPWGSRRPSVSTGFVAFRTEGAHRTLRTAPVKPFRGSPDTCCGKAGYVRGDAVPRQNSVPGSVAAAAGKTWKTGRGPNWRTGYYRDSRSRSISSTIPAASPRAM